MQLLVELCRHGARTSSYIYPLTVNSPWDNFKQLDELTLIGAQQHYNLGRYLSKHYLGGTTYNPNDFYV